MLEFANRPPMEPEDVSLSDAGKSLLEFAKQEHSNNGRTASCKISALGSAACSELIEAFDLWTGDTRIILENLQPFNRHILNQAAEILGPDLIAPFAEGTITMQLIQGRNQEVAA